MPQHGGSRMRELFCRGLWTPGNQSCVAATCRSRGFGTVNCGLWPSGCRSSVVCSLRVLWVGVDSSVAAAATCRVGDFVTVTVRPVGCRMKELCSRSLWAPGLGGYSAQGCGSVDAACVLQGMGTLILQCRSLFSPGGGSSVAAAADGLEGMGTGLPQPEWSGR